MKKKFSLKEFIKITGFVIWNFPKMFILIVKNTIEDSKEGAIPILLAFATIPLFLGLITYGIAFLLDLEVVLIIGNVFLIIFGASFFLIFLLALWAKVYLIYFKRKHFRRKK